MMPPNNNTPQDHDQNKNQQKQQEQVSSSETKKRPSSSTSDEQKVAIKCPRCDSPNTKFCYYNNYSLTQPRHFCKTCRRYWTNGGSLRNVPVGGGCRKKQKFKHSSSQSILSKYSSSPSLDFHLGGLLPLPLPLPLPFSSKVHHHANHQPFLNNQFSSSFQLDHSLSSNSLMGLNNLYPFSSSNGNGIFNGANGMNFMNVNSASAITTNSTSLASSIESLSCMNQDLHLKLQQQRLATMFGGGDDNKKDDINGISSSNVLVSGQVSSIEKPQTILFQNLDISKTNVPNGGDAPMEWLFGNSYSSFMMTPTITTSSIGGVCINGDHDHGNNNGWINNGVNAWSDVQQQQQPYTALP
ncbi:unnamed protein product [Trifolium pratense]|uniref:Uncharacterized protein n=1 Tax=Trifolium pratense TaxID=57577 RepID=A0ACB0IUN4_TRIPR|nr:unnamed protein product [Trifolium pratense]